VPKWSNFWGDFWGENSNIQIIAHLKGLDELSRDRQNQLDWMILNKVMTNGIFAGKTVFVLLRRIGGHGLRFTMVVAKIVIIYFYYQKNPLLNDN